MPRLKERLDQFRQILRKRGGIFLLVPIFLTFVFLGYTLYMYFVMAPQLANADFDRLLPVSTKILDRHGQLLYEVSGQVQRTVVKNEEIPAMVKQATIVSEDRDFYAHPGINLKSIGRAGLANIRAGKVVQGGSTITQQLVKNTLLTKERTFSRKIQEALLALMIETRMSKDEILTAYLNSVSYGGNILGIQKAGEAYFGKDLEELSPSEVATLAVLPQAPTELSPYNGNKHVLEARRNEILNQLYKRGLISKEDFDKSVGSPINANALAHPIVAPHFSLMVRDQLIKHYGREKVEKGGLTVRTTLDRGLQAEAEKIIENHRRRLNNYGANNAGAIILEPQTGEILALVGSFDYYDEKIDGQVNMTTAPRQPGSAFKPIVYATLFSQTNYSPGSIIYDVPTVFPGGYKPNNYTRKHYGPLPVKMTLGGSLNLPAVKAAAIVGVDNVLNTAENLGLTTLADRDRYGLSVAIGAGEVKLMEMAAAFGTFANRGQFQPAAAILSVQDLKGKTIYEFKPSPQQILAPEVAYQISNILSDNGARTFIFGPQSPLAFPGHRVAVKTGTSENWRDAFAIGYTTNRVVGVWTGNNSGRFMARGADSVVTAAPTWRALMEKSMQYHSLAYEEFPVPEGLRLVNGYYVAGWQGAPSRLAFNSEFPQNPAWESPVQEYIKKKQEEVAQEISQTSPESGLGGPPDDGQTAPAPEPEPTPVPSLEDNGGPTPKSGSGSSSEQASGPDSGEPAPTIQ